MSLRWENEWMEFPVCVIKSDRFLSIRMNVYKLGREKMPTFLTGIYMADGCVYTHDMMSAL